MANDEKERAVPGGKFVNVEFDDGIAWVAINRPEKRNAISPPVVAEMVEVLDALETDGRRAAEIRFVNKSVPRAQLRQRHGDGGSIPFGRIVH